MTKTRKTLSTAIAAAFIATAGLASIPASASAAGLARIAPVETTAPQATQVHYFGGGYYHHHRRYFRTYYQPQCYWAKRQVLDYYGYWHWERYQVCR